MIKIQDMKKNILSIIALALSMMSAFAQTVSISDATLNPGETKIVSIYLTNAQTNIVSFQMDLALPEGITVNKAGCALGSRIADTNQELTIGKQPDGSIRFTSTSLALNPITGTSGEIIKLSLTAASDAKGGTATLKKIIFATSNSQTLTPTDVAFKVNVPYTLTYKVDGMIYKTSTLACGTAITPETAPTKEGYTFSGWSEIPATMPANDVVVTGNFTINKYNLTYIIDGKEYKSYKIEYNSAITPESAPVRKGMAFLGWGEIPKTMPAHDVILEGTYSWSEMTLNNVIYQVSDTLTNYVSVIGNDKANGEVIIHSSLEIDGCKYSVDNIRNGAFQNCKALTSVIIPETLTKIGNDVFKGCNNLYKVILESNTIVSKQYSYNTSLRNIFGEQVKEYLLGEKVTSIGGYAFYGCTGLTSVTIPANLISIDKTAFQECKNIRFYAHKGTDGLLSVWNYGADPYEKGTTQLLLRPSISVVSTTQTSITYQVNNVYPELEYQYDNNSTPLGNNEYLITGLMPELSQPINLVVKSANNSYSTIYNAQTSPISPTLACEDVTASSLSLKGSYTKGDAKVVSCSLTIKGIGIIGQETGTICGLEPYRSYDCNFRVVVESDNGETYTYSRNKYFYTDILNFATQQPRVISAGNVIVAADTNLNEEESNVGFEWRRTDWTDDFASNSGGAYLYGGRIEGYIRNLNTDKLWKYRAYYESDTGKRYYGGWVGIDPTNTSYFEPTVYTYAKFSVKDNIAEVKGYAMRGTEDVKKQGFMYWKKSSSSTRGNAKSIPANAMVVEAKGNVMIATLENLDYDTEYCYVAFATTANNETFYGEEQTFKTDAASQDVIDGINDIEHETLNIELSVTWYDLNGRRLSAPQKGINIIRYSDGTSRKILVK